MNLMVNTSKYTQAEKVDESGEGRGLDGRRDADFAAKRKEDGYI